MTKIVVNRRFGGFGLSPAACQELGLEESSRGNEYKYPDEMRAAPELVACVEKLGTAADGQYARLEVVEIPDDVEWEIGAYDGAETIEEKHRSW